MPIVPNPEFEPRRFSMRRVQPMSIGVTVLVLIVLAGSVASVTAEDAANRINRRARELAGFEEQCREYLTAAIAAGRGADDADDEAAVGDEAVAGDDAVIEGAPPSKLPAQRAAQAIDELLFGGGDPELIAACRHALDNVLHQKLGTIDWVCGLSDSQKQKLELAGRGDIKRCFDRVADLRTQFDKGGVGVVQRISREVALLRVLLNSGLHDEGSLFAKSLLKLLTAEQVARFHVIEQIENAGGKILKRGQGAEEASEIRLSAAEITDSDIAGLADMTGLQLLTLDGTQVTDAGLAHVKKLKNLKSLNLARTQISSAGVVNLQELIGLQNLDLTNTRLTDAGLSYLGKLSNLRYLYLYGTQITDAGLDFLEPLKNLEALYLGQTRITDTGLTKLALKEMKNLTELGLEGTPISDAALAQLAELTKLRKVNLGGTQVTDIGLAHLTRLTSLQYLSLNSTRVTPTGIANLKQALPGLKVDK